jgi:putative nucleotidyltransferase with HDIG domain
MRRCSTIDEERNLHKTNFSRHKRLQNEQESGRFGYIAVEAAMKSYARRFGEDEEKWGLVGLLHDFDYEKHPDLTTEGHPVVGTYYLRDQGVPEVILRAILSHAGGYTGVQPESKLEKTLIAVDELTGFITAVALVRPSKKVADVELSSVKKKWKAKEFAAAVNRQEIEHAAADIGMSLDEHIQVVLDAMKANAEALGL